MTDVQMAYYVGRNASFEMGGVTAHAYYEIESNLNTSKFEQALNKVISYQPMLRCVITENGEQKILPDDRYYSIPIDDLSGLKPDERDKILRVERESMSHKKFNTHQWPLFEFKFFRITDNLVRLCIGFDLLIADGTSMRILVGNLMKSYNFPEKSLGSLEFSFRDYVLGLDNFIDNKKKLQDKKFWLEKLETFPDSPNIITKSGHITGSERFERLSFRIDTKKWSDVKENIRLHNISPSAALCTLYALVLAHQSNQPKHALNITVFNRLPMHRDVKELVGDFTSIMLLDIDLKEYEDFWLLAQSVQGKLVEGLDHNTYTGIEFIRDISKRKGLGRSAAMPIVFTSMIFNEEDFNSIEKFGDIVYSVSQTPQVYLDCQVMEMDGELSITWDYVQELLDRDTIEHLFHLFSTMTIGLSKRDANIMEMLKVSDDDLNIIRSFKETDQEVILNYYGEICPIGVIGELFVCNPKMVTKYGNEEALPAGFLKHKSFGILFPTGNLAILNANGKIELKGKVNDLEKVNRNRINKKEIERALGNHRKRQS